LSIRTLALADSYVKSDYGDQFSSEMFNLFREVLRAPSLRGWLRWDDAAERALDTANLERLFSLLSRETDDEDEEEGSSGLGQSNAEPAITTGAQVRELAKIIDDPAAVKLLEESRSLQTASMSSGALVRNEIDGAIQRSHQDAERLFGLAPKMSSGDLDRIDSLTDRLRAIAVSRKRQPVSATSQQPWQVRDAVSGLCLRAVRVERYRALQALAMNELGRIKLARGHQQRRQDDAARGVYLLAMQSDPRSAGGRSPKDPPRPGDLAVLHGDPARSRCARDRAAWQSRACCKRRDGCSRPTDQPG
ncbi:MAG: hypothetical protein IPJ34_43340, partial [Myxococcales bacterium]|nr:hypothetical protein [Myxococcales bacterium]